MEGVNSLLLSWFKFLFKKAEDSLESTKTRTMTDGAFANIIKSILQKFKSGQSGLISNIFTNLKKKNVIKESKDASN